MERLNLEDDLFFSKSLICLFSMQSSSLYCIDLRHPHNLVEIENPLGWGMTLLLGSCRGALCIYNEDDGRVAIWNFITGWYTHLPPAADGWGPTACVYGFGYDDENKEYVLLRLIQIMDDPIVSVSICRQGANAWTQLPGILPYSLVDPRTMGVFLNGRLYWVMRHPQNSAIVLAEFHIHRETSRHHQFRFPDWFPMHLDLATLTGRLCLANLERPWGLQECLCFISSGFAWIVEISEEASLLFETPDDLTDEGLLQPLAHSQNGQEVLLLHDERLYWYNSHTNDLQFGMPFSFRAATRFLIRSRLKRSMILCLFGRDPLALHRIGNRIYTPMEYPWPQIKLLGSYRHFLCISNVENQDVAIWNPFVRNRRDFTVLPNADVEIAHKSGPSAGDHEFGYGFGYDDRSNEYVFLRLVQTLERPIDAVTIYRSRAWRSLRRMPLPYYLCSPLTIGVFVCCHLHWIMRREWAQDSAIVLVAFRIHTDNNKFVEVHLPDSINNTLGMGLDVLEGCLCLTIYGEQMGVNVWIMRDYELKLWDRLFSIPDQLERPVRPLAYCQDDYQVLVAVGSETLLWYDLVTKTVQRFHVERSFDEAIVIMDEPPR